MARFLLTGTYNSCNKGDAAMQLAALALLRERYPDAEITLCTPFPELDRPVYSLIPIVACTRRRLILASLGLIGAFLWRLVHMTTGLDYRWLLLSADLKATRDCDIVIDLSGDMQTESSGVHVAYSHFIPLLRALALGKPYVLCAQSVGPFHLTRPLARFLLKKAHAITVREKISEAYVTSLLNGGNHVRRTADLAFLLSPTSPERAQETLERTGILENARPLIGISMSRLVEAHYHKTNALASKMSFIEVCADLIDRMAEKYQATLLLVPHVTGPSPAKDDRLIAQRILALVKNRRSVHALSADLHPAELKSIIGLSSVFVGARMHANIAALSSGVPTVAIAYSHKTHGIMGACAQEDFVLDIDTLTPSELYAVVCKAFDERERIAACLSERIPILRREAAANFDLLIFPRA